MKTKEHSGSKRAVIFALIGNFVIFVIKLNVSFITTSSAMLAEAIHSIADCLNQVFLLIGDVRSKRPATERHSFGFSREVFFWSLLVAVILFFIGALFSVYEGIHKLLHPEELKEIYWIFIVLAISIVIEAKTFSVAYKEFRKKSSKPILKALEESTDTSLLVILLEDFAALTGLTIVLITSAISIYYPIFDAIGSMLVGLLLATISYKMAIEIKRFIVGESIPREKRLLIRQILQEYPLVEHINRMQTMVVGDDKYLVIISVDVDDEASGYYTEDILDEIKQRISVAIPEVEEVYIDIQDLSRSHTYSSYRNSEVAR
ncbi:MAG: cation diffusion facilitator family transporter [Bacteroidia bacterium]|nr:cation diffusion facilitator family transporter [Bacteroidia bacterium]